MLCVGFFKKYSFVVCGYYTATVSELMGVPVGNFVEWMAFREAIVNCFIKALTDSCACNRIPRADQEALNQSG